jgi:pilus assembly protein Flp/PilA
VLSVYVRILTALHARESSAETGAAAVEYALLAALIALAIIASVTLLGTKMDAIFVSIRNGLP